MTTRKKTINRLTGQQRLWLEHYLQHWNATRAAREAGYSKPEVAGSKLKHNPRIQEAITEEIASLTMSREEALLRLSQQARNEAMEYLTAEGAIDLPKLIAAEKQHLLRVVRPSPSGQIIEPHDAQIALIHILRQYETAPADELPDILANALDEISRDTAVTL